MIKWSKIKYFNPRENWGDADKVNRKLILRLDKMREYAKTSFIIHCAYEITGHAEKSYHALGMAVDGHFKGLNLIDQFLISDKFFGDAGIGIYGKDVWNNPGLHLDIRPYISRWACKKINNVRGYIPLTSKYLEYLKDNNLS